MVELLGLRSETNLGFPEALPIGQQSKGHAKVLIQATEGFDLVISIVGLHAAAKTFIGMCSITWAKTSLPVYMIYLKDLGKFREFRGSHGVQVGNVGTLVVYNIFCWFVLLNSVHYLDYNGDTLFAMEKYRGHCHTSERR